MATMSANKFTRGVLGFLDRNGPEILTGLGIAGFISTVAFAISSTPEAMRRIEEEKQKLHTDKLTPWETVKAVWKCYIPTVVMGGISTTCIVGANAASSRKSAALAAGYTIVETAFKEYQDKTIQTIGAKGEQAVRDAIAKEHVEATPASSQTIIVTDHGETRFFDALSGRYFKSDMESIRGSVNTLNRRMMSEMYISLNEFYNEIDLPGTKVGEDLGWNLDNGLIEVKFSAQMSDDNRTPCIVINYAVAPKYGYSRGL